MNIGEIVAMKTATLQFENDIAKGSLTYKSEKGKHLVFLFLGSEDAASDGEKMDLFKRLDQLGWKQKDSEISC